MENYNYHYFTQNVKWLKNVAAKLDNVILSFGLTLMMMWNKLLPFFSSSESI